MSKLGFNIRDLRDKKGLTQVQLGEKIGVAESTISLYEKGKREPDNATLERLADFFNVTTDYLLGRLSDLPQRAIKLSETMDLSEERKAALELFKEMPPEEQTKRLLAMYQKLKSLPLDQQKALETIIENLSVRK